jgi:hypothetical protein
MNIQRVGIRHLQTVSETAATVGHGQPRVLALDQVIVNRGKS